MFARTLPSGSVININLMCPLNPNSNPETALPLFVQQWSIWQWLNVKFEQLIGYSGEHQHTDSQKLLMSHKWVTIRLIDVIYHISLHIGLYGDFFMSIIPMVPCALPQINPVHHKFSSRRNKKKLVKGTPIFQPAYYARNKPVMTDSFWTCSTCIHNCPFLRNIRKNCSTVPNTYWWYCEGNWTLSSQI